jgi:hypothetical protein
VVGAALIGAAPAWAVAASAQPSWQSRPSCSVDDLRPMVELGVGDPPDDPAVSFVRAVVRGLPTRGCSHVAVRLELWGNPEGDPILPTLELGVLANAAEACDGGRLIDGEGVIDGQATLGACARFAARGVRAHDLTRLVLTVGGRSLPVTSGGAVGGVTGGESRSGADPVAGDRGGLPFTGGWATLTAWWALLLVGAGGAATRLGRRPSTGTEPTTAGNQRFW